MDTVQDLGAKITNCIMKNSNWIEEKMALHHEWLKTEANHPEEVMALPILKRFWNLIGQCLEKHDRTWKSALVWAEDWIGNSRGFFFQAKLFWYSDSTRCQLTLHFLKVQGSGEQELLVDNSKHGERKGFSGGKKCENSCLLTPYFHMQTTFTLNSFFTISFFNRGNFLNEH